MTEGDAEEDPEPDAATRIQLDLPVCPALQGAFRVQHEPGEVIEGHRLFRNAGLENLCAEHLSGCGALDPVPFPEEGKGQVFFPRSPRRAPVHMAPSPPLDASFAGEILGEAQRHLREARALLSKTEWPDPYEAGQDLKRLLDLEGESRRILAKLPTLISLQSGWHGLGFRDLGHDANERLGISRTLAQDLVRINRFGGLHPKMAKVCESGKVGIRPAVLIIRALGFEADDGAGALVGGGGHQHGEAAGGWVGMEAAQPDSPKEHDGCASR